MMNKLFSLLIVGMLAVGAYVFAVTRDLPSVEKVLQDGINPTQWTQVLASDGTPILSFGKFHHENVKLENVSQHFIDALLATEDRRFYQHHGVDPIAVARAVASDITHKKIREGGSTITQQLARNVFLNNERSFSRKVREAALAWQLEDKLTKDQILELYVNNVYFGEGAYGIKAASAIYFSKSPAQLTIPEAALLAGLPQAPSAYNPFQDKQAARERRDEVLQNLMETGKLSADDYEAYKSRDVRLSLAGRSLSSSDKAPFFNRYVMNQVMRYFSLDEQSFWQSGLKIYTTLDLHAQNLAENAVLSQSAVYGRIRRNQQAAVLSLNPQTGAILAYVGGKNYQQSQFDRVANANRSPGSLFKIFTYTTAIDRGYEPSRVYLDEPIQIGDWRPLNYDKSYHGYMTLAKALITSDNIVAVKVINELGADAVIHMAQQMGIRSPLQPYLGLTLGGSGVNLMEITSAFGVLANQGVRVEPYAIDRILDDSGQTIYREHSVRTNVLNRTTVDTMIKMMTGVIERGTGRAANIGRPVAGKTGTSDDYHDAWFIGFTPDVVTGVWVGNDDNSPMRGMTGGALPAGIWRAFMKPYMASKPVQDFDLAYSKPLAESDFTSYDIKNLSDKEEGNELSTHELQDGELQQDAGPPAVPGGENGVPLADPGQIVPDTSNPDDVERALPSNPAPETPPRRSPPLPADNPTTAPVQQQPMPGYGTPATGTTPSRSGAGYSGVIPLPQPRRRIDPQANPAALEGQPGVIQYRRNGQ